MTVVLILVLVLVAAGSFVAYSRAKKMEKQQGGSTGSTKQLGTEESRNVQNIQVGDIVSYFGTDYIVEGRLDYDDEGWTWTTYMLVDGDNVRWLAVEFDDQLEVSMWDETDVSVEGPRPPEFIEFEGERFEMVEWGDAKVTQEGETGRREGIRMEYFEYEGSGDRYLSVEKWGNEIEMSVGEEVNPYSLDIFPGSGR